MPFVNTIACVRLPTVATSSRCYKRFYLLGLCMLLIAMLLGTATWAIINFSATRALIPLIVVNILLSMFEDALVLAILQATTTKPLNDESHELPIPLSHSGPPKPSLIHPAFRDFNNGSLNSPRNFALPRERCLDITSPDNAPAIPVPDPYAATEKVNDVTVLPLHIHKHDSATDETTAKNCELIVDVKTVEKPAPEPGHFDKTPNYSTSMSEAERIITGAAAEQQCEEEIHYGVNDEAKSNPLKSPAAGPQTPQTPVHLLAPVIVVQQPTPTTPKSIERPAVTLAKTPTIRLVNQYLEIPTKTGHGSRRKK